MEEWEKHSDIVCHDWFHWLAFSMCHGLMKPRENQSPIQLKVSRDFLCDLSATYPTIHPIWFTSASNENYDRVAVHVKNR